jgi:hypothetical protein
MGAGLAGALSLGAVLAACGAPASQVPTAQAPAGPRKEAPAQTTVVKAYLIAAYYDHVKWKGLNDEEGIQAEEEAERLFPDEEPKSLPQLNPRESDLLPHLKGVHMVRTFRSDIFAKLPNQYLTMPRKGKDEILDTILGPHATKTDIGWMAIVDTEHFSSFMKQICGETCLLWRMYDIEVLPLSDGWTMADISSKVPALNDDRTTEDIYNNMTLRSWNSPAP